MKLLQNVLLVVVLAFYSSNLCAQNIQWASKIISFSSEYTDPLLSKEFKAIHILGRPSKYPKFQNSPSAWQSLTPDNPTGEYIIVGFDTTQFVKQVAIFENFGAGSISRIDALDDNNKLYLLKEFPAGYAKANGQVTYVQLPNQTNYHVQGIKISMNSERIKGFSQIDAVAVSDADKSIEESIRLLPESNSNYFKENLGININSAYNEICPVVSPDGKKIFFTRWKHPDNLGKDKNQDIWFSTLKEDKSWSKAQLFPSPINNEENNAICGISLNGKTILLNNVYGKDGSMEKGVSMSFLLRTGDYSFPKALKIINFKNRSEFSEYTLAPNGKVLLMTTETKDSYGGKDIYVSFLKTDETWTEPKNIGPVVNTGESESTPFIAPDGVTMYFSSSGHVGYGNNDIFLTRRLDDSFLNWSIPENVGPIVNTAQWDGYFSVSAQGDYAYFSSVENSLGAEDIFRIKIPPKVKPLTLIQINGTVINEESKEPILAKVLIRGQALADSMSVDFDPYNGDFSFMWPAKKPFLVEVKSKGFISKVERFDFSRESSFKTVTRQYALSALQLNKQFNLPTITFAQSKSELSPESFDEIDNIISILRENPGFGILLEGHTDNQGDWNENLKLSLSRVESVRDYLVLKGIRKDRIKVKGWGGTKPIMSNMVEERRKFNRRVEFTLYANE
jgi:outer membrane protein OmpA-like peptidoglycan-associated protein